MTEEFRSGFVALLGRPNAGKSTLLNHMVGQKIAITSDKPQTTRNRILGVINGENWQLVLLDTPGVHKPKDKLGDGMVNLALNTLKEVDVIYYLVDASVPFGGGDAFLMERLKGIRTPTFLLLNKIDLLKKPQVLSLIEFYRSQKDWQEIVPISALKGDNIAALLKATMPYLQAGPRYYPEDYLTDQPERVLAAEIVREKVLHQTREEIPHSVAVFVESMERRTDDLVYIGASIYVERDSQKGILIGKKGEKLRTIGSLARTELESILDSRVFLELWVKVKADWRNREKILRELGYGDQ